MQMRYEAGEIRCYVQADASLVGNVRYNILHGGVAATMLDSIGGVIGMLEIYKRGEGSFAEQVKKWGGWRR